MILWNNTDIKTKGIIVEKTPNIIKPKKRFTSYEIEGRNGTLVVDKGTYDTFTISVECHFDTTNHSIYDIKAFLDGFGTISIDNNKEYKAYIKNAIDFEKVDNFRKFIIQFECQPIATSITSTTASVLSSPYTLSIAGATANMYPVIKITGSGNVSITINNKTFYLYDLSGTYYLDCDAKEIIDTNGVNRSNLMKGDFPYLVGGKNIISSTGTISEFKIEYKKAFI